MQWGREGSESATFAANARKLKEPISIIGLKSFQHSPKDKRKIVFQKWVFIVQMSMERNNEFYRFWRQHSFSFILDHTLLMSTIFECERTV